jgi:Tol biopolymer transport system component
VDDGSQGSPAQRDANEPGRLDSWKEIAAYLKRDVSTVQRWERREGMPVHRHLHDKLGSVYAFRSDLDTWSEGRNLRGQQDETRAASAGASVSIPGDGPPAPDESSAADANTLAQPGASTSGSGLSSQRSRHRFVWPGIAAGLFLCAGAVVWLLESREYFWRNPVATAQFRQVTDFEGTEQAAAISRDGKLVAFLADRDGPVDVWVTQVGTGQFYNLTRGSIPDLVNPAIRTLVFSPDGALVLFWARKRDASKGGDIDIWAVPTLGGQPRTHFQGMAEIDWSSDGKRLVYHTPGPGDPLFVKAHDDESLGRQIFVTPSGLHAHFPLWSTDQAFIYFVQGSVPDTMDIWRIRPAGGPPERITFHASRVSHPVLLDRRTLLYLATDGDGSGPWLYSLDTEKRVPHRLSFGGEKYTSLAASADGRRLVVTVANPKTTLWRVPISDRAVEASAASRISLPSNWGSSPRVGPNYLLYVSSNGASEGVWKLADGRAIELWSAPEARIVGSPAIARDGRRIAFSAETRGRTRLYVMNADGTDVRTLGESLDVRGAPAWAADGQSIAVGANYRGAPQLLIVSLDGRSPVSLVSEYSVDPAWAPDGQFLVYSGADVGTTFEVKAVSADARAYPLRSLTLSRGARRLCFLPGHRALVVMRGEIEHKNLWLIDLETGTERQLTNFGGDFIIRDFDISPDGREIVFDRVHANSDIAVLDLALR